MADIKNVRNFWIKANIDGYKNNVAFGPKRKDGGFEMTINQRDKGGIKQTCYIRGWSYGETIHLEVYFPDTGETKHIETKR